MEREAKLITEEGFSSRKPLPQLPSSKSSSINKILISVVMNVLLMFIAFLSNLKSVATELILVTNFFEHACLIECRKLKLGLRLVVQYFLLFKN